MIKLVAESLNVNPLLWALQNNPEFWDQNTARTESEYSPHHEASDIWARFSPDGADHSQPHDAIWYPCADVLPVRQLVYPLMAALEGDRLGGVLITKIPPGKSVKPHTDKGWHASFYQKFAVQIQAHPKQSFNFKESSLVTKPGDVFWFDNSFEHWVTNDSDQDRITMIVCIKTDKVV